MLSRQQKSILKSQKVIDRPALKRMNRDNVNDRNAIAKQTKAGENSRQEPKVHAEGMKQHQKPSFPQREASSAVGDKDSNKKDHRSAQDINFACLQEANPTVSAILRGTKNEKYPNSPDLKDLSADWTEC